MSDSYNEQQGIAFQHDVVGAYQAAGQVPDLLNVVWSNRMVWDARDLGYAASRAKHLRELKRVLGLTDPRPLIETPRLTKGERCLMAGDQRFHVRGVSAFRLAHMLVNGEEAAVDDYLGWCLDHKINWLRVFCMCKNMFELPPGDGLRGLDLLAERTANTGLYVEAVALADTFAYPTAFNPGGQVAYAGEVASQYPHLTVELVNEPGQKWQLFTKDDLVRLAHVPVGVPFTLGAADGPNDESREYCYGAATYQNVHCDRTRAPWGNVRHVREQQVLSEEIKQYVIDDEPMNAKDLTEAQCFGLGALERICQIGGTAHADWGKECRLPTAEEQRQFDARRRGWDSVPETFWGRFANFNWKAPLPESPVLAAVFNSDDARVYASVTDTEGYAVLLHAESPMFKPGWSGRQVDGIGEASVWHCTR